MSGRVLVDAAVVEPRAVFLIELFDVLSIPATQEVEERGSLDAIALFDAEDSFFDLAEQVLVSGTVFVEPGKIVSLEELFFADEVHARELEKPIEMIFELFPVAAADEG